MKNLFLLPTDKPSRLWVNNLKRRLELDKDVLIGSNTTQHIYITNSEEIKEGDGVILISGRLVKAEVRNGQLGFQSIDSVAFLPFKNDDKKIILTTDQELIADGVQKIDDEFLEWFVKNPSCEEVEIKKGFPDGTAYGYNFLGYKIIIPQEKPKQETLEESVERLVPEAGCELNNSEASYWQQGWISGHIAGAEWQAERSYSETLEFGRWIIQNPDFQNTSSWSLETAKFNFEQFKKKS